MSKQKKESPAAATAEPSKQAEAQATQADSTSHTSSIVAASEPSEVLKAALFYHSKGFSVIPINPGDKKPAVRSWKEYCDIRAHADQLHGWLQNATHLRIAVVLGNVSGGLVCRDFDRPEAYHAWALEFHQLAQVLPTVKTLRGFHVYFRTHTEAIEAFPAAYIDHGDGEMRVKKCYCLLPPSRADAEQCYKSLIKFGKAVPQFGIDETGLNRSWLDGTHNRPLDIENLANSANPREHKQTEDSIGGRSNSTPQSARLQEIIQGAISRTLPTKPGERNRRLFDYARELKAIKEFAEVEDAKMLRPQVREWFRQAYSVIGTKTFDDTWMAFTYAWPRVKYAAGCGKLEELFELAKNASDPPEALEWEQPKLRLLIRFCRELQINAGHDNPFPLACRDANDLLGTNCHQTVWLWLKALCREKVLFAVSTGNYSKGTANTYRYVGVLD